MKASISFLMVFGALFLTGWSSPHQIMSHLPDTIDPNEHYLFYLHGQIIETQGRRPTHPRFGVYEYDNILQTFADSGFVVISEARAPRTPIQPYAQKVASQIDSLIQAGVPASHIAVVGASKGAAIAGFVSILVQHPEVRYILLAICNRRVVSLWQKNGGTFSGKLLYIYEKSDTIGKSCRPFIGHLKGRQLTAFQEIALNTGLKHGFLYRPLPEWIIPAIHWAKTATLP